MDLGVWLLIQPAMARGIQQTGSGLNLSPSQRNRNAHSTSCGTPRGHSWARAGSPAKPGLASAANLHLYAASEVVGGLVALYAGEEVLLSPLVLARSAIEHSAHTVWLLGDRATTPEERLARAFLEVIVGAEQAKMQAGRLTGRGGQTHTGRRDIYKAIKKDVEATFGAPPHDHTGRPQVNGQRMPAPEQMVLEMNRLSSQPLTDDEIHGTYGYLSNFVHPTSYALQELFEVREENGESVPELARDIEFHNKLARLTVVPFYHALFHTVSYHGWNGKRLLKLNDDIDRLLPGVFVAGPEAGPVDGSVA
jgi:hypothetical protein